MARSRRYETEALVLRVVPFGETSQVVHLATPEHGLVAALAKGALRPGPELQGGLVLGTVGRASLSPRRGAELEILASFRMREGFQGLARDLGRYYATCHVLELLRAWVRPGLPNPALYRAGTTALRALAGAERTSVALWVVWFEARAVAAAGHRPRLDACGACGEAVAAGAVFAPAAGGLAHAACVPGEARRPLGPADRRALERLYTDRIAALVEQPPGPREVAAVRRVHDLLIPHLLERRVRTLEPLARP